MMGYAEFKRLDAAPGATIDINKQYDTRTYKRDKLIQHEVGFNLRAMEPGKDTQYGILHVHWKPKDPHASVNQNISAHFKDTHQSQRTSGKGNKMEIPHPDDSVLYNRIGVLAPVWSPQSPPKARPANAQTGWTSLKRAHLTKGMVDAFRNVNDEAALVDLGKNKLYDLSKWDHDGWNAYMMWMATGR